MAGGVGLWDRGSNSSMVVPKTVSLNHRKQVIGKTVYYSFVVGEKYYFCVIGSDYCFPWFQIYFGFKEDDNLNN